MVLRTGAILLWCACLIMAGMIVTDIVQNGMSALAHRLWQPLGLAVGCVALFVLGWRLWALRRWAGIAALIVVWLFSLGEPWRPAHYPAGIIDVTAAIGASLMICVFVAAPLTWAWLKERSRLKPGF